MTRKASMVGGTISFLAVAVLSLLSLDMVEGGGFFMEGLVPLEVRSPETDVDSSAVKGDSTETPSAEKNRR